MEHEISKNVSGKIRTSSVCILFLLTALSAGIGSVNAVGANQNDINSGSDLPDSQGAINTTIGLNGASPYHLTPMSAELAVGDDEDWFAITLNPSEGLAVQIDYNPTYTSPTNGTVYNNEFDLAIYDANMYQMDFSYASNPEYVTTNNSGSTASHGGTIYVHIYRYYGYGSYNLQAWTWTNSQPSTGQNDMGWANYDFPDTQTALLSDPYFPMNFAGSAPYTYPIAPGQVDPTDNEDWLSFNINTNEGLAFEITYPVNSVNNGTTYANDAELLLYDANMNFVDSSMVGSPELVTTNNSQGSIGGTVYIKIQRWNGYVDYDLRFWVFSTSSSGTTNQNDIGNPNYDLPDTYNALLNDPFWPTQLNGGAPIYSGISTAELDLNGDNEDWMVFTLNPTEGFALEISYSSFVFVNGSLITNDFSVYIYDTSLNTIDFSTGNNPDYVTTNNSAAGAGGHGGVVFVQILRNSGFGAYDIEFWTWNVGSGGGGTGSSGTVVPNPCNDVGVIGSGNVVVDMLEPNNNEATASLASILPIYCSGLSFDTSNDEDYFEVQLVAGVTYYVNITFMHSNGDIDTRWEDVNGLFIDSSTGVGNTEYMSFVATTNVLSYIEVYTLGFSGSNYNIEITTDNPGGGQTFTGLDVTMNNLTNMSIELTGLVVGDNYQYSYNDEFTYASNSTTVPLTYYGPFSFTATATTQTFNHTLLGVNIEGEYEVSASLADASGSVLNIDSDSFYYETLVVETTSSTTGEIYATNLTSGSTYAIKWATVNLDQLIALVMANPNISTDDAVNATLVGGGIINFTAVTNSETYQVSWNNPTSMDNHTFFAVLYPQNYNINLTSLDGYIGIHSMDFIPQLPSAIITSYSFSTAAANNDFTSEGLDLVPGDTYYHQFRVEDPNGADINYSAMTTSVATAQNMSFGTFYYQTPTTSGQYCLFSDLYDANFVQIVGDYVCLQYVFDDDSDGVANEMDLCPNTTLGTAVDSTGCAADQRDSDSDGYNDDIDDFPFDDTQWLDTDGDGYGDNLNGNYPDYFPTDDTQWSDIDGDGYGDNANGNNPDAFPFDATQWHDVDGDGYGDNANGNNPDLWPTDPSQWTDTDGDGYGDNPQGTAGDAFPFDGTQWADTDSDGFGDNMNGNNPDMFPNDGTQWADSDGDGYGDNANGNDADKFPSDASQWYDSDNDGYGDNQQGNNPDAFPSDGTQWSDQDGDGYGDNANGNDPDKFPQDSTQWHDADYDGYGDNANGNSPDLCPGTPFGETVDTNGCSTSQTDSDQDGVSDIADGCPNTPLGEFVNANGCSETQLDDDNDGVVNQFDLCAATPLNAIVNAAGCANTQLDSDNDGINDALDSCPSTTPEASVDGFGCAADQRDIDSDGVNDNLDTCPNTPLSEVAANNGCSESQTDSDLDGVFNDVDQCPNTTLLDLNGDGQFDIDSVGCSPIQYDDDNDMIDNTIDLCPVTPLGEQVNADGCAESQLDEDSDDIWNSDDLCYDTPSGQPVDQNGCSQFQLDDDQDGLVNAEDGCPNTPIGEIIDENGCSLTQLDSDGDGVNDLDDAFPTDSNESVDSDRDGVPDRLDAYPLDAARSETEKEDEGNGFLFILAAIFAIGVIGALLVIRNKKPEDSHSPFAQANYEDQVTETNMAPVYETKEVPTIEQAYEEQKAQGNQTWEENGVHWSITPDGTLSYFDDATQSWILFQN